MLEVEKDLYNGLIVNTTTIDESSDSFKNSLTLLLIKAKADNKNLIWLDLTTNQNQHIAIALELGFEFHNCEPKRVMLTYQVKEDAYIPVPPTHTIGVGAVVINKKNELLMVRDRIHQNDSIYKLPGGMVEHADSLNDGVEREVWEETGIKAKLIKMVSVLNSYPHKFNKSNMYIVFQLEALTTEINIIDTHEIEEAIWMPLKKFFLHEEMSRFQKNLVYTALEHKGITPLSNDINFSSKKFIEFYG